MNWDAISAISQLVGSLAVVLSVLYLAVQVHQSTRVAKLAMQDAAAQKNQADAEDFYFKSGKTLHKIRSSDILYFEGQREYVRLVTSNEQLMLYRRLKDIGEQLRLPFIRIHNSYIVNMQHVIKVVDNHVYVSDIHIPISDKFRDGFLNAIRGKLF